MKIKKDIINIEYIAANYLEANENLGEKDLKMRIKICRKEAKETQLWLKHILVYEIEVLDLEKKHYCKKHRN